MLQSPRFIVRHVEDIPAAKDFYTEKLGFKIKDAFPNFVEFENDGGATYALGEAGAGEPIEIWWVTDNIDATFREFQSRGIEVLAPPTDMPFGRTLTVKDVSGTSLHFLQPAANG